MTGRLLRDESGIAMGLAVIMIVLIGVMGAGLLVFVRNDLEAVVEVNQGQKAFDAADAGVQAAALRLYRDNIPAHYDVDAGDPSYEVECDVTDAEQESEPRIPAGENWSPEANGVTKQFEDGQFTVTIEYLRSTTNTECLAPETPGAGTKFFKVLSTGEVGDATRKVEAIYTTSDTNVPKAFFARESVTISGSVETGDVSLFSIGDVTFNGGASISGQDLAYGDWTSQPGGSTNAYNSTPRGTTAAGVGTPGNISNGDEVSGRDYDADVPNSSYPKFVSGADYDNPGAEITFPFNAALGALDADTLCEIAKEQDSIDDAHYQPVSTSGSYSLSNWPASNAANTIVCVDFVDGSDGVRDVKWDVGGNENLPPNYPNQCKGPIREGILVVRNGNFKSAQNKALFSGPIVIRGGALEEGDYTSTGGNPCLEGFANASGEITLSGNVEPYSIEDLNTLPGFYGVQQWSWRELYQ